MDENVQRQKGWNVIDLSKITNKSVECILPKVKTCTLLLNQDGVYTASKRTGYNAGCKSGMPADVPIQKNNCTVWLAVKSTPPECEAEGCGKRLQLISICMLMRMCMSHCLKQTKKRNSRFGILTPLSGVRQCGNTSGAFTSLQFSQGKPRYPGHRKCKTLPVVSILTPQFNWFKR